MRYVKRVQFRLMVDASLYPENGSISFVLLSTTARQTTRRAFPIFQKAFVNYVYVCLLCFGGAVYRLLLVLLLLWESR